MLHGVDLTVARGETIGVVGESGSGKTTLARVLMGLVPPSAGSVEVGGIDIAEARHGERRRFHATAQMVFQDPVGSLSPRRTAGQAIREPMSAIGLPAAEQDRRLAQLVGRVGLDPSILGRRPHQLSGGQAQRVAIARALSVDPTVVVFDEPTSALDVTVQAQILELVAELAASADRTFVFISHDLAVVRSMCDRVAVLYLGRIVEHGTAAELFAHPAAPLHAGAARRRAAPRPRASGAPKASASPASSTTTTQRAGCPLRPRCPFAADVCAEEPPLAPERVGPPGRLLARRRDRRRHRRVGRRPPHPHRSRTIVRTAEMPDAPYQLSVDIGGTFVDAMELDQRTQQVRFRKASTTPDEPWRGVLDAVDALGTDLAQVELFIHGTTLGLNAVLERRGGATGILTNDGIRDIFLIGRGNIPSSHMYDFTYDRPPPLVERRHTVGVRGRLDHRGREIEPLDEDGVQAAARSSRRARRAVDRGVLPALLPRSHATSSAPPRSSASSTPTSPCRRRRHRARVPRVRAHGHDRARRLHPADLRALRRPTSSASWRPAASPGAS